MAKIKHTKNEFRLQRETLERLQRYLPILQIKKQQLRTQLSQVERILAEKKEEEESLRKSLDAWVKLFCEPLAFDEFLRLETVRFGRDNVAGVDMPVLEEVLFRRRLPNLAETPPWFDYALEAVEQLATLGIECDAAREQARLLSEELQITTQRVNLFEHVKIPECRENMHTIRIFLEDQETMGVARARIAKKKIHGEVHAA